MSEVNLESDSDMPKSFLYGKDKLKWVTVSNSSGGKKGKRGSIIVNKKKDLR
jgi:hypothetical protein